MISFGYTGKKNIGGMRTETAPQPDETLVAGRIHLAAIRFITESNQTRRHSSISLSVIARKKIWVCLKIGYNCMARHVCVHFYIFYGEYDDVKHPKLKCTNFRQTHFQTPCLFAKEPPQHK